MKREPTVFSWNDPLEGLPLVEATSPRWIEVALSHLDRLLVDHAWCEFKAASAGLGMIARFPDERALIRPMIALAKEEMLHFRQVFDLLEERKVPLGVPPQDPYVRELRHLLCARGKGLGGLGDHLLVNAFVEARSCERFRLLATALSVEEGQDADLGRFYATLAEAEGRHWETFRDLACSACGRDPVEVRIEEAALIEAQILASLPVEPRMH